MEWRGKSAALYGRFTPGARDRLAGEIARRGATVARDLTRRSDVFVIGALATTLIEGGRLGARIEAARARAVPIFSERRVAEHFRELAEPPLTLPLDTIEVQAKFPRADIRILAAFDIVRMDEANCRFGDAAAIKSAAEILAAGRSLADAVRILARARDLAPKGRHKIVLDVRGQAALQWESGRTTLEGQGVLPLNEESAAIEELFEAAAIAETEGDLVEAARLYDLSGRVDRKDPIAPFNLGNVRLEMKAYDLAILSYRMALARDAAFAEARYNLAAAYEAQGKLDLARDCLRSLLQAEPAHADAIFNLAQLELKQGDLAAAKVQFERYLTADPPSDWAEKARKAITYCSARLTA